MRLQPVHDSLALVAELPGVERGILNQDAGMVLADRRLGSLQYQKLATLHVDFKEIRLELVAVQCRHLYRDVLPFQFIAPRLSRGEAGDRRPGRQSGHMQAATAIAVA